MITKNKEKELATRLRREGKSYSEILTKVPVAKSTLSLWLQEIHLSKPKKQRLTEKRLLAARRGGEARKKQRLSFIKSIYEKAFNDIDKISKRDLWLMATMLYWAEGSKEKEGRPGSGVQFSNSDQRMLRLFLKWLIEIEKVDDTRLIFEIYIHENSKNNLDAVKAYWSKVLGFPSDIFRVYLKKNKIKTNRKNVGIDYYGLVRIKVGSSSTLNRKLAGWVQAISEYCGMV